jgi:hypothetical protein
MFERDDSTPLKDLIRNTGNQVMFYDVGAEIGDYSADMKERINDVKRAIKIPKRDKTHDDLIESMLVEASYGGKLVVYFYDDFERWINLTGKETMIHFSGKVHLAVVDHSGGSGWDSTIPHNFTLPFNPENVFIDKNIKYNYTYAVCGMISRWCESTEVTLLQKKTRVKAERSKVNDHLDKEARYNKTFKEGKCTFGDMDIKRHRNAPYRNEYPCGNKCTECGTFWID